MSMSMRYPEHDAINTLVTAVTRLMKTDRLTPWDAANIVKTLRRIAEVLDEERTSPQEEQRA
jgi:hypothetical protein